MLEMFTDAQDQKVWNKFVEKYNLDEDKQQKFYRYMQLLLSENEKYNLTAITDNQGIIKDHFQDSLSILSLLKIADKTRFADIGSGAGFPGIPLAIMLPEATVSLIEVQQKKASFLQLVAQELGLSNVKVFTYDFRTFLRLIQDPIDIFTARASLHTDELVRIFKPSSHYNKSLLVYWASKNWIPTEKETVYLDECKEYKIGDKKRSLCIFKQA